MSILIKNVNIINENKIFCSDILTEGNIIKKIGTNLNKLNATIINGSGLHLMPGIIDDQVHFREPGLTHKGNIYTESKAAVAGGITSFMEMPNTNPQVLTQELLEQKYSIAEKESLANFSFFMGVSNDNIEEVLKTNPRNVGGIKVFMGSSTGNMLVDNKETLNKLFKESPMLIAVHCEDERIIKKNIIASKKEFGENIPISKHPEIRSVEACYQSSSYAVELAKKHDTRLHVFHISTEKELILFNNLTQLKNKRITSEVCIHHLWFDSTDYLRKGALIKWNPAIKKKSDKNALLKALIDDTIDVIATDHAPHTIDEKNNSYLNAPSGGPLVQHALPAMLTFYKQGKISLEKIVEKMCHNPAICFQVYKRGFVKEGYFADLVLVDLNQKQEVKKDNILYKCGWSPFEGEILSGKITHTFINGHLAYDNGFFDETKKGKRLLFDR